MRFVFAHGWGFDSGVWRGVHAALGAPPSSFIERGYFGALPEAGIADGPVVAVGHSMGALHLLRGLPPQCAGLVVVNGFDRFAGEAGDECAVPRRVVERMIAGFRTAPDEVLENFRARCGCGEPVAGAPVEQRLLADLELLRDADLRETAEKLQCPLLVLHGSGDVILPPAMRDAVFAACPPADRRTLDGHGHLLLLSAPEWCAAQIAAFAARVNGQ